MPNSLVSARVPQAKREAASSILKSIGATASDLINTAYDYLLATRSLPVIEEKKQADPAAFKEFVSKSTVNVQWLSEDINYKEFMRDQLVKDYEAL